MHLSIDGSLLPALFVLAFAIWACGSYIVDLFKGARTVLSIIALIVIVLATIITVMSFFR